ncbi:hypothetical protein MHK_008499 [Candidatus Magnetomorum sp. HK-1]|nr:hypothetical protein MHK_008499 [Candidatus Magnetomorum sp. HK-1]
MRWVIKKKEKLIMSANPYNFFDIYGIQHFPSHLIELLHWDKLIAVLCDLQFIEAKCAYNLTYELIENYNSAIDAILKDKENQSSQLFYNDELKRYISDLIAYSKGEQKDIPQFSSLKTQDIKKSKKDRVLKKQTKLSLLKRFAQFVSSERHGFVEFGNIPGFVIQQAYNSANSGPIADAGEKLVKQINTPLILLHQHSRPAYDSFPPLIGILKGHQDLVESVSITWDGSLAASGGRDKVLRIWDLNTGKCILSHKEHNATIMCCILMICNW